MRKERSAFSLIRRAQASRLKSASSCATRTDYDKLSGVEFAWANFGIGLPWHPFHANW